MIGGETLPVLSKKKKASQWINRDHIVMLFYVNQFDY